MGAKHWIGYTVMALVVGIIVFLNEVLTTRSLASAVIWGFITTLAWLKALHDIRKGGFFSGFEEGYRRGAAQVAATVAGHLSDELSNHDAQARIFRAMKQLPSWRPELLGIIDQTSEGLVARMQDRDGETVYESPSCRSISELAVSVESDLSLHQLQE